MRRRKKILLVAMFTVIDAALLLTFLLKDDPTTKVWISQLREFIVKMGASVGPPTFLEENAVVKIDPLQNDKLLNNAQKKLPNYFICASLDEQNYQITGELELSMNNVGTDTILFYTYPYSWASMKINNVRLNGQLVDYDYDGKNLLFNNVKETTRIHVAIEFETPVPQQGTRFGVKDGVWLITTWYPILGVLNERNEWIKRPDTIDFGDPFYFRFANYKVYWTSDVDIKWLSSGTFKKELIREAIVLVISLRIY
jgi:hypothetical protein